MRGGSRMNLHELQPNKGATKDKKRIGRGIRSGKGKTAGRGYKGQTSRSGDNRVSPYFEGGQTPLHMRVPKVGFRNPFKKEYAVINLSMIEKHFNDGDEITKETLLSKSLVKKGKPVKILGMGEVTKKFKVKVDAISSSAKEKIQAAGGTVELPEVVSE
jgi:large subunit ribosomal protein L15